MEGSVSNHRCAATNRRGEPCGRIATEGRLCVVHSGKLDLRAVGRLGGRRRPGTALRKALQSDEQIRRTAADVIQRGMAGDPSVTKTQLDAARSVFSFRASEPPRPPREFEPIPTRGRAIVGLRDILTFAEEIGALDALLPDDAILRAADRLRERRVRATGESDRTDPPAEDEAALQRGLRRGAGASRHKLETRRRHGSHDVATPPRSGLGSRRTRRTVNEGFGGQPSTSGAPNSRSAHPGQ
jgi:hypothetical protein